MNKRILQVLVLAAIVAFAFAGIAGSAMAKQPKKTKKQGPVVLVVKVVDVGPGQSVTDSASCPASTQLVGGGYTVNPVNEQGVIVYSSHRDGLNGWTVAGGRGPTATGAANVVAQAYCRKHAPALTEVSQSTTVSAGGAGFFGSGATTANCSSGTKAVAGGFTSTFSTVDGSGLLLTESRRSTNGTGWTTAASNVNPSPAPLVSYTYCAKETVTEVSGATTSSSGGSLEQATSAKCPTVKKKVKKHGRTKSQKFPTRVVGGGFMSSPPGFVAAVPHGVLPLASGAAGGAWELDGFHIGTAADTLTAYAYCSV